ncbi:MAG TPA: hypothetical protein VNZ52_16245, partial [Candidatus Thermoplasmatota archaeon]|nr:hypothetical protein [Candidatus Thermoplasmatota archaeon]
PRRGPCRGRSDEARDGTPAEEKKGGRGKDRVEVGGFESPAPGKGARGEYVAFQPSGQGIQNFTVDGVPLWTAHVLPADRDAPTPKVKAEGAHTKVEGEAYRFDANDIPTAEARFTARAYRITFPENVTVQESPRGVVVHAGDLTGVLYGKDVSLEGRTLRGEGALHFLLRSPNLPVGPTRESLDAAKMAGTVGAEVVVRHAPGEPKAIKNAVMSYGNVTVETRPEDGGVTFVVDGNPGDPRVLIFDVDAALVRNATLDKLTFRFDNETISPASSLADILNPDDDGLKPEFFVVSDLSGTYQVIVSVPHYSVHTITIQSITDLVPPAVSVTLGVLAATGFLVLAAVTLFRRPKQ